MHKKTELKCALALMAGLFLVGCGSNDDPQEAAEEAARDAGSSISDFAEATREQTIAAYEASKSAVVEQYKAFTARSSDVSSDAKAAYDDAVENLAERIDELKNASEDGYDAAKENVDAAYKNVRERFTELQEEATE